MKANVVLVAAALAALPTPAEVKPISEPWLKPGTITSFLEPAGTKPEFAAKSKSADESYSLLTTAARSEMSPVLGFLDVTALQSMSVAMGFVPFCFVFCFVFLPLVLLWRSLPRGFASRTRLLFCAALENAQKNACILIPEMHAFSGWKCAEIFLSLRLELHAHRRDAHKPQPGECAVVESVGDKPETFKILPAPNDVPAVKNAAKPAPAKTAASAKAPANNAVKPPVKEPVKVSVYARRAEVNFFSRQPASVRNVAPGTVPANPAARPSVPAASASSSKNPVKSAPSAASQPGAQAPARLSQRLPQKKSAKK